MQKREHGRNIYTKLKMDNQLWNACISGDIKKVNRLIDLGADNFDTCLLAACYHGHLEIIDILVEKLNGNSFNIGLCMYNACTNGQLRVAEKLVELGATNEDINRGFCGACEFGNLHLINRLAELGATSFNNGLYLACATGHLRIVDRLVELGANNFNYCLFTAIINENFLMSKKMVSLGAKFKLGHEKWYNNQHKNIEILKEYIGPDITGLIASRSWLA